MRIKWLGHSCFLLASNNGTKVLTDPFNEEVGYVLPAVEADIVTTSHQHYDHNYIDIVKGNFTHLKKPGIYLKHGIGIIGVPAYHDEEKGSKRGENIVFKFTIDGINVCHCGDLGHILSSEQLKEIGDVDVLLLPVGGIYTLNYSGAMEVVKLLNPIITIPMHFYTEALKFPLEGAEKFLSAAGGGKRTGTQEIQLERENLGPLSGIVVLDYK